MLGFKQKMASAIVRSAISKSSQRFKLQSSWCLSNLLSQHSTINETVREDAFHEVPKSVSFHSDASSVGAGGGLPSYMRGAVFWEPNKPLTIEEFHIPRPKAGEVLVKNKGDSRFYSLSFDL